MGLAVRRPRRSCTRGRWRSSRATQENADWNVGRLLDAIDEIGDLENTLDLLHLGRQRLEHGGHDHRLVQRDDVPQRRRARRRPAAEADRAVRRDRGDRAATTRRHTSPRRGHMPGTPPSSGASRCRATSAGRATRWSSPGRRGSRRTARCAAVHALHRHRARPCSRPSGYPNPRRRRHRAGADGRHELPLHLRGRRRRGTSHGAVLRVRRIPRDLQGRLVGVREAGPRPLGLLAGDDEAVRPRGLRPGAGRVGAVLPAGRLLPGPRRRRRAP